ncbi:MAG TPA: PhzF family phenazine biosynthesis protein [Kineosporiaceae bacterium]|nr:PhzF family phenazine biosynthesis protein [Kineosporiaceae bacterium]
MTAASPFQAPIFQLDAFTTRRFAGNPAAVVVLDSFPAAELMQAIAAENNLAETAFLVRAGDDYGIRWFTPLVEVPLCGHATLASAAVVMERLEPGRERVTFGSASGPLVVTRSGGGYVLDFPARYSQPAPMPAGLVEALGLEPLEFLANAYNYLAVLADASLVRGLAPDLVALGKLDRPGIIVTAPGDQGYDFISRYFAPAKGIPEDPVTGAAHCMLAPYWSNQLGRNSFRAHQASSRGGDLAVRLVGDRVELEGSCVFYLEGRIAI